MKATIILTAFFALLLGSPIYAQLDHFAWSSIPSPKVAGKRPLLATLEAALASIERGKSVAAINQLNAFQNKVQAQVGRTDPDLAMELIEAADEAIHVLESDGSGDRDTLAVLQRIPAAGG